MFVVNVHVNQEMASSDVSLPSVSDWEVSEISLFWQADWLMLWNVSPSVSFARFQVYLQCWCSNCKKHTWSEKQEWWVNLSSASKPDHQRISMCSLPLWSAQSTLWMLPGFLMSFSHSLIIRLILWSNLVKKFFDLVKSWNSFVPSKYVQMLSFWFATVFNGAWVEGRMCRQI